MCLEEEFLRLYVANVCLVTFPVLYIVDGNVARDFTHKTCSAYKNKVIYKTFT